MTTKYTIVARVPFGQGILTVEQIKPPTGNAYIDGVANDAKDGRRLRYKTDKGDRTLHSLVDLLALATSEHVNLQKLVSQRPVDFAVLFSCYERLGTVVVPTARFAYLRSQYAINLDEHVPRSHQGELRFLVLHVSFDADPPSLCSIWWNLADMSYHKEVVAILVEQEPVVVPRP